jgi:hypothetical protein
MRQVTPVMRRGGALVGAAATIVGGSVLGVLGWLISGSAHRTVIHIRGGVTDVSLVTSSRWPWAIALASAGLFVIVFLGGIRAQKELNERLASDPLLTITTGNGFPWDHQDYQPPPPELVKATADLQASFGRTPPPTTGGKRFRVENARAPAKGCRVTLVIPAHELEIPLDWEPRGFRAIQERDLAPGETAFVALLASRLPVTGTFKAELRIFAEGNRSPVLQELTFEVEEGGFPQVLLWDDNSAADGARESTLD